MITNCVEIFHMSPNEVLDSSFVLIVRMIEEHNIGLAEQEKKINKEDNKTSGNGGGGFENLVGVPGVTIKT